MIGGRGAGPENVGIHFVYVQGREGGGLACLEVKGRDELGDLIVARHERQACGQQRARNCSEQERQCHMT